MSILLQMTNMHIINKKDLPCIKIKIFEKFTKTWNEI